MTRPLAPGKNAPEVDIVYTPTTLAIEIIQHFPISGTVLEPCRGGGAFYNNFPDHLVKDWCEIAEGRDFFDYKTKVDWIVTNPPWSKMREFIDHSTDIADNIVFLVTINHLMTKARMRILKQKKFGFKEIYGVKTPKKDWPQSGFQLAALHIQRGWNGPTAFTGDFG